MALLTGQNVLAIEYKHNAISIYAVQDLDNDTAWHMDLDGSDGCEPAGRTMQLQHQICNSYPLKKSRLLALTLPAFLVESIYPSLFHLFSDWHRIG